MKSRLALYAMILPTALLFCIFIYLPYVGMIISFRDYDIVGGIFGTSWVGLKYFMQFFQDPYFFRILRNTVLLNVLMLAIAFPAPIIFALLVNEIQQRKTKRLIQSVSYLPHFLSVVIIVGIMIEVFSSKGLVNIIISNLGLHKILFFNRPEWFRFLYVSSSIWEGMGWGAIIYFASLAGINPELYEYASIEGANRFGKIRYITIPCIMTTIVILFILTCGSIMTVAFDKVFLMQSPGIYETSDVIATYTYRRGILGLDYSYATAVGIFNSIINVVLLIGANRIVRSVGQPGLW